jgi:hypothetical protein
VYNYNLARTRITSPKPEEHLIGYNYYIEVFEEKILILNELIYTTITSSNPTDLEFHDAQAQDNFQNYINSRKTKPSEEPSIYGEIKLKFK